jgi:hypothetical protein
LHLPSRQVIRCREIPLGEIVHSLDGGVDTLEAAVQEQLAHLDRHIGWQRQLRYRLSALLRAVEEPRASPISYAATTRCRSRWVITAWLAFQPSG